MVPKMGGNGKFHQAFALFFQRIGGWVFFREDDPEEALAKAEIIANHALDTMSHSNCDKLSQDLQCCGYSDMIILTVIKKIISGKRRLPREIFLRNLRVLKVERKIIFETLTKTRLVSHCEIERALAA